MSDLLDFATREELGGCSEGREELAVAWKVARFGRFMVPVSQFPLSVIAIFIYPLSVIAMFVLVSSLV